MIWGSPRRLEEAPKAPRFPIRKRAMPEAVDSSCMGFKRKSTRVKSLLRLFTISK